MMKKDAYTLWEQEGDLEAMRLFFHELRSDSEKKERIKQLALEKIREEELSASLGQSPRNILIPDLPPKESLREKVQRRLKSFWWRWQWKLALPVAAIVMFAFIGIGMESLKDSSQGFRTGFMAKFTAQDSAANTSVGMNNSPKEAALKSEMENGNNYGAGAAPRMGIMADDVRSSAEEIAPIMPVPEPQTPPADDSLAKKITYSMNASLQVEDVSQALALVTQEITGLGGYVVHSSENNHQSSSSAYATFKIPSQQLEGFKGRLEEFGKVLNSSTDSDDVTNEYYDTQSRLKNLLAQETRYLEIFKEAKTVDEILQIESYLSSTRMQIEQLQGQVKLWDHQVAYSTVSINFQNTPNPVSVDDPWRPVAWANTWQAAKDAVLKTISSTWNGINYLVVGIAYALPYLLGGAGLFGAYKAVKKVRRQK
ncbi:hypothetical protein Desde_2290 [Desulfitobacterium dehalogenans ATCC 51507]|uniref:DUF4349 domain-containing protein n=1 Tax=Desulfitobacterium dehalogenans (strain ATCC 51507 / DSM 9161 / JW/IU-DC1) TaxID=756499 RepID=I4A9K0_DESDJ|nr:DUF4349 domain-containing protein [Desulfitobacterium dehalogenans]AFM00635.1 hypothetical protein Desde_2290 [Desulfitobacterium dehalogenans ATCC 51507]